MKTIEQLLELSKNPYYNFTKEEREVLDSFLSEQLDTDLQKLEKIYSTKSSDKTRVTVRNVVKKTNTYPLEDV